jgi:hypothetical protein
MSAGNEGDGRRRISSLSELPRDIAPPRDLWPQISAHLQGSPARPEHDPHSRRRAWLWAGTAAAMLATLAIGVLLGRASLPGLPSQGTGTVAMSESEAPFLQAAYANDPRYAQTRAELLQSLDERLAALPPQSRARVVASLATIGEAIAQIQEALGHDPGNALLQELLVNSRQDEMRVLIAVRDAAATGAEI